MEEPRMAESSPVAMAHPGAEVISLDAMRSAMVANFEQDDLDVPAFLRKRGEVM
jgi:predicted ATPase